MVGEFPLATIAWCAAVIFGAFIVRGMSGFGAGLVATPLLVLLLPVHVVVPMIGPRSDASAAPQRIGGAPATPSIG